MTEPIVPGIERDNPLWMALVPRQITLKDFVVGTALTIVPVIAAILVQRPALRQAIQMRFLHESKEICQGLADVFQKLATKSAQEYQKVQL